MKVSYKRNMNKLKLRIEQIAVLSKYILAKILSVFYKFNPEYKNIWLFCERGVDARDNAYYFYKFMKEKNIGTNLMFCITKKSADYEKVRALGKVIEYGSLKHLIILNLADYLITTHNYGYMYKFGIFNNDIRKKINTFKAKIIFLQHGIIKDKMDVLIYPNAKFDLFICGAKPEYEYIKKIYNHPKNIVQYTGLARFDNLHNFEVKNQILLMPTWRLFLNSENEEGFKQSEYFKRYSDLIKNKKLINILEKSNYKLVFYPHFEVQKFIHLFDSTNSRVIIADFKNYDVQELLKESKLLITDMKKPVLHYQFDTEKFFNGHYSKGYFDYTNMGFGKIKESEDSLINEIEEIINNECKLLEKYNNRINEFFPLHDTENCERIYKKIIECR